MTTASEWADKITDAAKGVPGSLSWDEVHCLIFEALCKAEADGFKRGRREGLEEAVSRLLENLKSAEISRYNTELPEDNAYWKGREVEAEEAIRAVRALIETGGKPNAE